MKDKIKYVLLSEEEIDSITDFLAEKITDDYKNSDKKLVLVCLLKGSIVFTGELMKKISLPLEVEAMKVSSYGAGTVSSGAVSIQLDLMRDDLDKIDLLIVEDIVDSGITLSKICEHLKGKGAKSVKTCALLDKPDRRVVDFEPDYRGKIIPDEFVVGFGLDYNEEYRNLPFIGVLKPEVYGEGAVNS